MWRKLLQMCWLILVVERSVPVFADMKETQSENQVPDGVSIITEISVQEIVNGQTVQRKPTQEELRLVEDKILGRASTDLSRGNEIFPTSIEKNTPEAVEDSSDSDSDLFNDWNSRDEDDGDDYEDLSDMESILGDGGDRFDDSRHKTGDSNEGGLNASVDKDKNNSLDQKSVTSPGKPPSGDYRKFFHTEKKNFSNVKDVKIMISEEEGDFFDFDEDPFLVKTTTHATVLKQGTDKFEMIKEILAGVKMNGHVNSPNDFNAMATTPPSFENETLPSIISELSPESSTTMKTDDTNKNVNNIDSKISSAMLPEVANTFIDLSPGAIDNATEVEEVTGVNEFQETTSVITKNDFVITTITPEIPQETTAAPDVQDSITFKDIPEENGSSPATTTVSNSQPEIPSTETSADVEEIPKTFTSSEIINDELVIAMTGPVNESVDVTEVNREDTFEDDNTTSTGSEISKGLVVTVAGTVNESVVVTEGNRENTLEGDTTTSTGIIQISDELVITVVGPINESDVVTERNREDTLDGDNTTSAGNETSEELVVTVMGSINENVVATEVNRKDTFEVDTTTSTGIREISEELVVTATGLVNENAVVTEGNRESNLEGDTTTSTGITGMSDELVITVTGPVNESVVAGEGNRGGALEDDTITSTGINENSQEMMVTVASPVNESIDVTEGNREGTLEGDTTTSTGIRQSSEELVVTVKGPMNEDVVITEVSREDTFEGDTATSTGSQISEELVVTVTVPINESDVVTERNGEDTLEGDTTTSTVLPVTLENTVLSETEVNVATTVSYSETKNETVEVLTELDATALAISPEQKLPEFPDAETTEAVDSEVLAENGVSVPDISEIISLAENSYHEIPADDLGESDISNIKEAEYTTTSVFKELDVSVTKSHLTTETKSSIPDPEGTAVTKEFATIPSDTYTEQIPLDSTEQILSTISSVVNEEAQATTGSTSGTIEELVTYPSETEPAADLLEHESSSTEPSSTTENGSNIFIVTAVDYSEGSTENVNIRGSTETPIVTTNLENMDHNTPPASTESVSSDSTEHIMATTSASTEMQSIGTKLTVVDQTTQPSGINNKNTEPSTILDADEAETHDITPSEVESILNAQLEEYEEDDYDTKEGIEEWTIFGGNEKEKDEATENNINLDEINKNIVEDYDPVVAVGSQMTPVLKARIMNNSAEFSVKISKKDDTTYIPATAYVKVYGRIVNITWKATADQNNSLAMRLFENEKFYIIKEIMLYIFRGNKFTLQRKSVAINPDPILDDTMPGRTRVVMMRDGTYITFPNVEFLRIADSTSDRAENSASASRSQKLWHFEVASISITTVLIVAIVLYVIALKRKTKLTLREKDELPQVTSC